jgi:hypothetical protein
MKPKKKEQMNEHLNMIFLSLSFSLPSQEKMSQSTGMLWSAGSLYLHSS